MRLRAALQAAGACLTCVDSYAIPTARAAATAAAAAAGECACQCNSLQEEFLHEQLVAVVAHHTELHV
jgi:hypothetical protein